MRKTVSAALVALSVCGTVFAATAQEIYNRAIEEYNNRNYSSAIALMEQVLPNAGDSSVPYVVIGDSCYNLGESDCAFINLSKAYELGSRAFPVLVGLGYLNMDMGRDDVAYAYLAEATSKNPNDADVYWNLGLVCDSLGNDRCTLDSMVRVIELAPNKSVEPYRYAGALFSKAGDIDNAAAVYNKGLDYFNHPALLYGLADIYNYVGDYDSAIRYSAAALDMDYSYLDAWYIYGIANLAIGGIDEGERACDAMTKIDRESDMTEQVCRSANEKRQMELQIAMMNQQAQDQINQDMQQAQMDEMERMQRQTMQ